MNCCDVNGLNTLFSGRVVAREKRRFERHGPTEHQRRIITSLPDPHGCSVLDIGCGIGALSFELLKRGASHAYLVDVSRAYLQAARALTQQQDLENKVTLILNDLVQHSDNPPAEIVLLDRVVCCYPDARALLERAASLSTGTLAFTYPQPSWLLNLFQGGMNFVMKLLRRDYRLYLHPPALLMQAATSQGHRPVLERSLGVWRLVVLVR